jgi:hypothetical protein
MAETATIAANDPGIALVNLGRKWIIAMVKATKPNIIQSTGPLIQLPVAVWNWENWEVKITMAKPFKNPNITA